MKTERIIIGIRLTVSIVMLNNMIRSRIVITSIISGLRNSGVSHPPSTHDWTLGHVRARGVRRESVFGTRAHFE